MGGPYLMDHSSIVYLLDRNGRFSSPTSTHEAKAEQIARRCGQVALKATTKSLN